MKTNYRTVLYCFTLLTLCMSLTAGADNPWPRLKTTLAKLEAEAAEEHKEALEQLKTQYHARLKTMREEFTTAGELEMVLAVAAELERFQDGRTLPAPSEDGTGEIARIATAARAAVQKLEAKRDKKLAAIYKRYIAKLDQVKRQLVIDGKIDEALKIHEESARVNFILTEMETKLSNPPDEDPSEVPEGTPATGRFGNSTAPKEGLVAYDPLNSDAKYVSGHDYHGTVHGAIPTSDRRNNEGHAFSFSHDEDRIDISNVPVQQSFSMSAWFRTSAARRSQSIVCFDGSYILHVGGADTLRADTKAGSSSGGAWTGGPESEKKVNDGRWHHVVWSRDEDGRQELYLDSVLIASGNYRSGTIPPAPWGGYIGLGKKNTGQFTWQMKGAIDDVLIYDRPLSAKEVRTLYQTYGP